MTPEEGRAWRKVERTRLIAARMAMSDADHRAASQAITEALAKHFPVESLPLLGCYWPFRREYNVVPLMRRVVEAGGQIALPVVLEKGKPLEFRPWTHGCKMDLGVWDIPHPAEGPAVIPGALLIPVVGFDEAGYRLGYGSGFYDMTIAAMPSKPICIGVGFELQRMETIHPHPLDVPMDYIITEAGLVHTLAAAN